MWRTVFTKRARKDLLALEKQTMKRIAAKLEKARENPRRSFSQLADSDYCKLRIGDYRVIAVLTEEKTIEIRRIGHRKNIYNKV